MMFENNYLHSQEQKFLNELDLGKKDATYSRGAFLFPRLILLLMFLGFFVIFGGEFSHLRAEDCTKQWTEEFQICNWKCRKCGYISYDQIYRCPVCGKAKDNDQ